MVRKAFFVLMFISVSLVSLVSYGQNPLLKEFSERAKYGVAPLAELLKKFPEQQRKTENP